jgi:hypothetical protein
MTVELYQKLYKLGHSKAVTIPKNWITRIEGKEKRKFERVRILTFEDRIEIYPDFSLPDFDAKSAFKGREDREDEEGEN